MKPEGKPLPEARAAKSKAVDQLGAHPDVVGIGLTSVGAGFGIKVNLRRLGVQLPDQIEGVPLVVDVVGNIRKLL